VNLVAIDEVRALSMDNFERILLSFSLLMVIFGLFGLPKPDTPKMVELNVFKKSTGESVYKFKLTSFRASKDLLDSKLEGYLVIGNPFDACDHLQERPNTNVSTVVISDEVPTDWTWNMKLSFWKLILGNSATWMDTIG